MWPAWKPSRQFGTGQTGTPGTNFRGGNLGTGFGVGFGNPSDRKPVGRTPGVMPGQSPRTQPVVPPHRLLPQKPQPPGLYVQGTQCLLRPRGTDGVRRFRAMEKYENLGLVGEGSYGMVLKCKHKETGQYVAIKKFLESEDDKMVKKIAMREVRMLKQLRHENLVNLIEVFRRKKRLYLVFEFVDHTVLDDLERCPNGLNEEAIRKVLWQVLKGIEFCHLHNIIHRDIKPENILVSKSQIVKLCDFGFARTLAQPGEAYTDYVATRWYRAPELLVGDTKYGRAVDIWAIGCLLAEMLTGEPLFPGDSDIDQLYHIVKCFGNLTPRHREIFHKNPLFMGMRLPEVRETEPLEKKFPRVSPISMDLMKQCLRLDANDRPTCSQLLKHELFTKDGFAQRFSQEIKQKIQKETDENPLLKSQNRGSTTDRNRKDNNENSRDNKDSGSKKKKKEKDRKESKDSGDEKPKRRLPDPEKFTTKKSTPPSNHHPAPGLPAATHGASTSKSPPAAVNAEANGALENGTSPSTTPTGSSMPPIQASPTGPTPVTSPRPMRSPRVSTPVPTHSPGVKTPVRLHQSYPTYGQPHFYSTNHHQAPVNHSSPPNMAAINNINLSPGSVLQAGPSPGASSNAGSGSLRASDKVKKTSTSYYKKTPAPNHHSVTLSPQPILQTEKTSLHDKTIQYDKMTNPRGRWGMEGGKAVDRRGIDGGINLPEVRGAEANPNRSNNKSKKSYLATIPHITNLDPFTDTQNSSPSPDKDPNFPLV